MLKTQSSFFTYSQHTEFRFPDIKPDAGDNLLVPGESGIGKTTLPGLIASLPRPRSGSVELMGTVLHELPTTRLDRFPGKHIGLLASLLPAIRVFKINIF